MHPDQQTGLLLDYSFDHLLSPLVYCGHFNIFAAFNLVLTYPIWSYCLANFLWGSRLLRLLLLNAFNPFPRL
jgi:hypothetical protein